MMKVKIIILGVMLSVLCFCAGATALASVDNGDKIDELEIYVERVKGINEELAKADIENVSATLTLNTKVSYQTLEDIINTTGIDVVQVQARGVDAAGERITFASKTYLGLEETDKFLRRLAQENDIDFLGYISIYALIDSNQILDVQNDEHIFLLETCVQGTSMILSADEKQEFPHSLAWALEDLYE